MFNNWDKLLFNFGNWNISEVKRFFFRKVYLPLISSEIIEMWLYRKNFVETTLINRRIFKSETFKCCLPKNADY